MEANNTYLLGAETNPNRKRQTNDPAPFEQIIGRASIMFLQASQDDIIKCTHVDG